MKYGAKAKGKCTSSKGTKNNYLLEEWISACKAKVDKVLSHKCDIGEEESFF